jgi:hypothetical protein
VLLGSELLRAECQLGHVLGLDLDVLPQWLHLVSEDEDVAKTLVVPPGRQQFLFGGVGERKVADVMAESSHSDHATPVAQVGDVPRDHVSRGGVIDIGRVGDDVEHPASQLQHS